MMGPCTDVTRAWGPRVLCGAQALYPGGVGAVDGRDLQLPLGVQEALSELRAWQEPRGMSHLSPGAAAQHGAAGARGAEPSPC